MGLGEAVYCAIFRDLLRKFYYISKNGGYATHQVQNAAFSNYRPRQIACVNNPRISILRGRVMAAFRPPQRRRIAENRACISKWPVVGPIPECAPHRNLGEIRDQQERARDGAIQEILARPA